MDATRIQEHRLPSVEVEALLEALESLGVGWWTKDAEGRYTRLSAAGHALFGLDAGEALGRTDAQLMSPASASALRGIEAHAAATGALHGGEQPVEINGMRKELACAVTPLPNAAGRTAAWLGVWLDRSALRSRETELRSVLRQLEAQQQTQRELRAQLDGRAAQHAGRVIAREAFEEQLAREIDLSLREHREFAIVCIGIDPLAVEDAAARARIVEVFDGMLRGNTRAMDVPSRLDGESFALLLSGVGLATAHARMESLRRQCAGEVVVRDGEALHFSVSMGVASYPHTSQTRAGLIGAAQAALDQARKRGGNHVALASIAFGPGA
ncbi:MAG TPA: GGDEF domain-containing protein [Methylibium sp.]|uniref:sensor domain-containing diguanylate cyclase n=1 Tax=Methylibium sp. TaxID=2067992 RepID=UPI002DBF9BA4|nr:GGDEF domain-containing protein [Methylibium sp.]HEU4459883.1 GGDEF domain-containing protein [Methylibium sp.]